MTYSQIKAEIANLLNDLGYFKTIRHPRLKELRNAYQSARSK